MSEKKNLEGKMDNCLDLQYVCDDLQKELDACAAGPWRPIAEAPRDGGQIILLRLKDGKVILGVWREKCGGKSYHAFYAPTIEAYYCEDLFTHFALIQPRLALER
jgi:hypothetical protein